MTTGIRGRREEREGGRGKGEGRVSWVGYVMGFENVCLVWFGVLWWTGDWMDGWMDASLVRGARRGKEGEEEGEGGDYDHGDS